ncbi:MAG: putative phosphohydrolase [Ilumatobacteraceae bacterium]|nr:putative phosphohydrolase [Ilumatobacteraceae bacterium]
MDEPYPCATSATPRRGTTVGSVPSLSNDRPVRTVDDVVALYERWGPQLYDDLVSQLDHALQCASFARAGGAHDTLIAASLLHDIGHLVELDGSGGRLGDLSIDRRHEATAVRVLAGLFPTAVTAPIALHVEAKRYLCAVDPAYTAVLSEGSVRSLATQGGPMDEAEVARFEALPSHGAACDLRRWDDLGKIEGMAVAPLDDYVDLLRSLAVL